MTQPDLFLDVLPSPPAGWRERLTPEQQLARSRRHDRHRALQRPSAWMVRQYHLELYNPRRCRRRILAVIDDLGRDKPHRAVDFWDLLAPTRQPLQGIIRTMHLLERQGRVEEIRRYTVPNGMDPWTCPPMEHYHGYTCLYRRPEGQL